MIHSKQTRKNPSSEYGFPALGNQSKGSEKTEMATVASKKENNPQYMKSLIRNCWMIIFIFSFIPSLYAQTKEYVFENIGIEHGLSQSTVLSSLQDRKGFLWFGTQDGLNRYDGYHFKIFRPNLEKPSSSITDGLITKICEAPSGNLLIGTAAYGFDLYDPKTERFYNFRNKPDDKNSICSDHVPDFTFDRNNDIWALTDKGFSKLHFPISGRYDTVIVSNYNTFLGKNRNFFDERSFKLMLDEKGNCIIQYKKECYLIPKNKLDFEKISLDHLERSGSKIQVGKEKIIQIGKDRHNHLWLVYPNRMERLLDINQKKKQVINFKKTLKPNLSLDLFVGSDSCLYFMFENKGMLSFHTQTGDSLSISHEAGNDKSITASEVSCVVEDQNGILWFSTRDGISKFNSNKIKFKHFDIKPGNPKWMQDRWPFAFSEDSHGQIWVGTYQGNGIYVYNKSKNTFRSLSPSNSPGALKCANDILVIYKDSKNQMWVCSNGSGLACYDEKKDRFQFYQADSLNPHSIASNITNGIIEDKTGSLWIPTEKGLSKFNRNTKLFTNYYPVSTSKQADSDRSNALSCILIDEDGVIWLGTESIGLVKLSFDGQGKPHYKFFRNIASDPNSISSNQIFAIAKAEGGKIWIGTNGAGLNLFDPKTERFKRYTVKDGLSNNVVYGMQSDPKGRVWASTNFGLSMLDPKTQKFKNYTVNQGLQSNEFNQGAYFIDSQGLMYFGGVRGYNVFDPLSIQSDSAMAKVVFTDFKLFNQSVVPGEHSPLQQSITYAKELKLNYHQRDFTFEFAATHFASPTDNQYAYQIEGYHKDWVYLGNNHSISFTSFPSGEYILKVKACNGDGIWGNEYATIKIIITPPFWKTNSFYFLVAISMGLLIVFFIKHREKKLIHETQRLENKVRERTLKISEQNEELIVQKEEILAQAEELESINEQLEKLSLVASKTDNAVIIMDSKGNVEWVNEGFTKLYGLDITEFTSLYGINICQNSKHPDIENIFHTCSFEKKTISYESINITKTKEEKWSQTTLTPVLNENGEVSKVVAIDSDISKLKIAEEQIYAQNKQITDSIQYARRIQSAIMPPEELITEMFPASFILFEPRDIVSGDFFWASSFWSSRKQSDQWVVAVADCTGHGVPGAFMSMLGIAFLNEIVSNASHTGLELSAASILEQLRKKIIHSLHQTGKSQENKDGMDISLFILDKKHEQLEFAGANNSMLIVRQGELIELKADKMPVGIYMGNEKKFTSHQIRIKKGDNLYLFSDGYVDQFGGPKGRKFLKSHFKELILSISGLEPQAQKQQLEVRLDQWQYGFDNRYDQIDDITILGLEI